MPKRLIFASLLLTTAMGLISSCDKDQAPVFRDTPARLRIVSLAPALSQMIMDLGQEKLLVGVAQHDTAAPKDLPVVGHWQDINTEVLLSLRPTHVLTMTGKGHSPPPHLTKLAASLGFRVIAYPSPSCVKDITNIILDHQELARPTDTSQAKCMGLVLDAVDAAQRITTQMNLDMARIQNITADQVKPSVLMVIATKPLMVSGPGTVHDELLSICGATNAAHNAAISAPVYDKEKLLQDNPDVIVMLLPGMPPLGPIGSDPRLAGLRGLAITAVKQGRMTLINDAQAHLPSSSITRIAAAVAKAIHPELADRVDRQVKTAPALAYSPWCDSQ